MSMNPYNGYSGLEREKEQAAWHDRKRQGNPSHPPGPCAICGDPTAALEPHSEDYSFPYLWEPPAEYALCKFCHVHRLHARFRNPELWEVHKAHVRRGGYSSDLKRPVIAEDLARFRKIADELTSFREALRRNEPFTLKVLRERRDTCDEWWEKLTTDPRHLTDPAARPRP